MDLNEIKNRAKDLLADLTEPRPERDDRPARTDVDDPAVRTDPREKPTDRVPAGTHERIETRSDDRRTAAESPPADRRDEPIDRPPTGTDDRTEARSGDMPAAAATDRWAEHADLPPTREAPEQRTATRPEGTAGPAADLDRHAGAIGSDQLPVDPERLVTAERAESYAGRWNEVKGEFVDEPRQAVARADALVGELLDELGRLFTQQRRGIEQDLANDDVSTEELRVALRRYRSFFDRLLSV